MKRRGGGAGHTQPIAKFAAVTERGSSFTECPVCGRSIALATASWHIEECLGAPPAAHTAEGQQSQQTERAAPPAGVPAAAPQAPLPAVLVVDLLHEDQEEVEVDSGPEEQQEAQQAEMQEAQQAEQAQQAQQAQRAQQVQQAHPEKRQPGRRPGKEPVEAADPGPAAPAPPFLRPPKAQRVVATGFRPSGSSGRAEEGLTADSLFATTGCELVPGFLPPELAEQVLAQLQEDVPGWGQQTWWIGDRSAERPGLSSKTSCHYLLGEGGAPGSTAADAEDGGYSGAEGQVPSQPAPEAVRLAAQMVAAAVSQRIQSGSVAALPLEAADKQGWEPSYALANFYRDGSAGIGAHSDRLTKLGPCPIIASLTLGATRVSRLHRKQRLDLFGGAAGGSSTLHAAAAAGSSITRIDAPLPHNTLVIMWPPCQEAWKHEVPKTTKPFPLHPKSGAARFNLTFRHLKPQWAERAPLCACGQTTQMKARQPRELPPVDAPARELSYFYACDSSKGPSCNYWREAPGATVRLKRQAALAPIAEDEAVQEEPAGPVAEIMALIDGLDAAVEERVASLMSAAEDAVLQLKNECKRLLVLLPAKTRKMQLADFQKAFPGDLQAGALEEIRERCAAMAAAAAEKAVPATGRGGRTAAKRGAEPETVLRTVRARRGPVAPPPKFSEAPPAAAEAETSSQRGTRSRLAGGAAVEPAAAVQQQQQQPPEVATGRRGAGAAAPPAGTSMFGGMPLQTPMPFAGEAMALPITMLTQKRGGRTKAVPVPEAAIVTTADGKQWALGAEGVAGVPDSHRQEVTDLLTAQFNFFAAALGKTVFQRGSRKR